MNSYGVSFSTKYAGEIGVDWQAAFTKMCKELPFTRLRLMSYWNEIEAQQGRYDFKDLDWQIKTATKYGLKVSLCLGMRQPRWPECHEPDWAREVETIERHAALYQFVEKVVVRYKDNKTIVSWQLENEALNKGIGECTDYNRARLRREYDLVKKLDSKRPIIMSTSDSIGLPIRKPRPDIVGFSIYRTQHRHNKYYVSKTPAWWYRLRAGLVKTILRRPVIIHELQTEPWGPKATVQLSLKEQAKSMDSVRLQNMINYAQRTGIEHIDMWGVEWWYWLGVKHNDWDCWDIIKTSLKT